MTTTPPDKTPISRLLSVMARLRNKENGCPWDIEQDFKSIAPCTIEEAYEVVDAIERGHMGDLKEELGDLLLQVVFHSQMASEENLFAFDDVASGIVDKLISRHPHVFGEGEAKNAAEVMDIWQAVKDKEEKASRPKESILDDIPLAFPALIRCQKIAKRAAKTGFEWACIDDVLDKITEELNEFRAEIASGDRQKQEEELGDVLFSVVQLARWLDLDAEETLRKANNKFYNRFSGMEKEAKLKNKELPALSAAEWDDLWMAQKQKSPK